MNGTSLASTGAHSSQHGVVAQPVLIAGRWREAKAVDTFVAHNPRTGEVLPERYPVSGWADLDEALASAWKAAIELRATPDAPERIGGFLDAYAALLEANADELARVAALETGLAATPRLQTIELPRTVGQLRQAAAAAREGSWLRPTIDTKTNIRSCLAPIGPVWVIGPNNFPFAFNGVAGGDFAAAIAAGNPVLAKGHPSHPKTSQLLAEAAHEAVVKAKLPVGAVQMIYRTRSDDGLKLIADARLRAVGFTGSRSAGLRMKAAADVAGKPFFGEMSSVNPLVVLAGALVDHADAIVDQLTTSVLAGTGQFCTKPGLVLVPAGPSGEAFIEKVRQKMSAAPVTPLLSAGSRDSLLKSIETLRTAGARVACGGSAADAPGFCVANTLLTCTGEQFLQNPHGLQTEAFGNATLVVLVRDRAQLLAIVEALEGNLTGTVYSSASGADDADYAAVEPALRRRVGRLLNDKMPTGVAVCAAMNHGGPFPATSQAHFTAVGLPAAIWRFTQLESYDNVRPDRLPACLRNVNPTGRMWRLIDGQWTQGDVTSA
ncbi:MAG: aldehyde dehydrogenase (NADP(+)) [Tepidisphaeraceae bacterium]